MGEGVRKMGLFGGAQRSVSKAVEDAESFERPVHQVSKKSARLGGLAPHLREMVSPWFMGAVAHSERYGATVQLARVAVLVALGAIVMCILLTVGMVWLSVTYADVRVIPYIVQTDAHNYVVPIGPAERV